jgi:hypothetical protein
VAPNIKVMQGKMEILKKIVFRSRLPQRCPRGEDPTDGIEHRNAIRLATDRDWSRADKARARPSAMVRSKGANASR